MRKGKKKAKKVLNISSSSSAEDTSTTSTSDSESSSEDPEIVEQKHRKKQKISMLLSFEEDQVVVHKKKKKQIIESSSADSESEDEQAIEHQKKRNMARKKLGYLLKDLSSESSVSKEESGEESPIKKKKKDKKRKRNVSSSSASTDSDEVMKKKKDKKRKRNVSSSSSSTDSDEVMKKKKDKKRKRNVSSSSSSTDSDEVMKMKKYKKRARNLSSTSPSTDSDEVVEVRKHSKDKGQKHMKTEKNKKVRKGKKSKKQTRKHELNHNQKIQKHKKLMTVKQRCSMLNFYSLLKNVGKRIPDDSWSKIKETVFGPMIMVLKDNVLKEKDLLKRPEDFEDIMKYYDAKGKFNFGGTVIEMNAQHVQLLFDIPNKGIAFQTKHDKENNSGEPVRVFKDITTKNERPTKVQIVKRLEAELAKPKWAPMSVEEKEQSLSEKERELYQNDALIASLVIMHLLSAVLFPRTATDLTWDLVAKALDLEKINSYNWARAVYEFLVLGLTRYDKTKIKYINGCLLLVQYWFLESTSYRSINLDKNLYGRPRFCWWDTTTMFDAHDLEANPTLLVDLVNGQGTTRTQEQAELDVGLTDHSEIVEGHKRTGIPPSLVRLMGELKIKFSQLLELVKEEKKDEAGCLRIQFDAILGELKLALKDILMKNGTTIFELEEKLKRLEGYTDKRHSTPEIPTNPFKSPTDEEMDKHGSPSLNPIVDSCNFSQCSHFLKT